MRENQLSFLRNLTTITDARTARVSSWDQTGRNKDYWLLAPNSSAIIAEIEGPGCINHIWITTFCRKILGPSILHPVLSGSVAPVTEMENAEGVIWEVNDPDYYRKVLIKMTWENAAYPSVLTPLGDFFCIGHSMPASFSSLPFNVSSRKSEENTFGGTASMNCYLPMVFNEKAKIEIINENELPLGIFFHIDYEMYHDKMERIAYFHASWKRELPCVGWGDNLCVNSPEVNSVPNLDGESNFVFLDVDGEGHFIGCNLSVLHFQGAWWGEGDDMIFIDGESRPSINGTGSEDYFNHAWGMQKNQSPYNGTIIHESTVAGYQVSYRFHITDPIHFKKNIRVTMEHGHANHLSDDWASTAYWYQSEPGKVMIQEVSERLPLKRTFHLPNHQEITMTQDMQQAENETASRNEVFQKQKKELLDANASRTLPSEYENVKAALDLRREYDLTKK